MRAAASTAWWATRSLAADGSSEPLSLRRRRRRYRLRGTRNNRSPQVPGEFDFIEWIRTQQKPSELAPLPAGDDLAILKWPGNDLILVGVDQVLDGVHFDSTVHSPRQIGRKAMNRNLSDCAAMACLPAAAVVAVALPRGSGDEYAKKLHNGLRDAADVFKCPIIGGDTGSWTGKLALSVTIVGRNPG